MLRNKLILKFCLLWIAIAFCFCTIANGKLRIQTTKPLFEIAYGEKNNQLNFTTWQRVQRVDEETDGQDPPSAAPMFRVSREGSLFIFYDPSASNEKGNIVLKVFNQKGKWLRTIKRPLEQLSGYALGQEHIFLWDGNQMEVLDFYGTIQADWSQRLNNGLQQARINGIKALEVVSGDAHNSIFIYAFHEHQLVTLELKPNGDYIVNISNGPVVFSSGKRYDISPANNFDQRESQTVYTIDGSVLLRQDVPKFEKRKATIFSREGVMESSIEFPSEAISSTEQVLTFADALDRLSDTGMLFVLLETLSIQYEQRGERFYMKSYPIVAYNHQGRFKGVLATLSTPDCYSTHKELDYLWDVDREGNLYYLDFQADHLRVMKVRAR